MKRAALLLALACSAPAGRFLVLDSDEVRGTSRICIYADAVGAEALTLASHEVCPPTLELDE